MCMTTWKKFISIIFVALYEPFLFSMLSLPWVNRVVMDPRCICFIFPLLHSRTFLMACQHSVHFIIKDGFYIFRNSWRNTSPCFWSESSRGTNGVYQYNELCHSVTRMHTVRSAITRCRSMSDAASGNGIGVFYTFVTRKTKHLKYRQFPWGHTLFYRITLMPYERG